MDNIEKLETDFAYLTDEVRQLNEIVTNLQKSVSRLEKQNEYLNRKIEDMESEDRPNRKPPHF